MSLKAAKCYKNIKVQIKKSRLVKEKQRFGKCQEK